jgi:hypothetical protein
MRILVSFSVLLAVLAGATSASACDELVSRLIATAVRPSIESLGCGQLGRAGLDYAEHRLESVCYLSSGSESTVNIVSNLKCKTSDAAFVKSQVSEEVSAFARVRGTDCQILALDIRAAGEIGKILLAAFDAEGAARKALQKALDKLCSPG